MLAPPVAKPKSAPPQRSAVAARRPGRTAMAHGQVLQRTIGNQAVLRLLAQRASATRNEPGAHYNEDAAAPMTGREAAASRNVSQIPAFPPARAQRSPLPPLFPPPRLPGPLQAKLEIGAVDDPLEHEADRVADQVMRMPAAVSAMAAPPQISRKCAACEEIQKEQAGPEPATFAAPAILHEVLRSPGKPLDPTTRADLEPRFKQDFSGVRVHIGASAEQSARDIGARAYTAGHNIVFGAGEFAPATRAGRRLLAHELVHVAQQSGGAPAGLVQRTPVGGGKGRTPASSNPSQSRKLRVTIVGHASPRWRGAPSDTEADRLNDKLADQRADAVRAKVEQLLRQRLGQNVPIEINVTLVPGATQPGLMLTASGEGSREALQEGHKGRRSDVDYDRRVDVNIELATTETVQAGRSLPPKQATSRHWSVTINEFKLMRAIGAVGGIELAIRNRQTGKEVLATAKLYGPGWFKLNPFSTQEKTGTRRVWLDTDTNITFQDFDGTEVTVTRVDAKLGLGETFMYLKFPSIAPGKGLMMYHRFGFGLPNGFHVWGNLQLWGDTSDEIEQKDVVETTVERRSSEGLIIIFPTEKYEIPAADLDRLDMFVSTWCRRLGWP